MTRSEIARKVARARRRGTYHSRAFQDWLEWAEGQLRQRDRSSWYDPQQELESLVVRREY